VAIVPNLIPLERQLHALSVIERTANDGPLGPLRVLVGLEDASILAEPDPTRRMDLSRSPDRLDAYQEECVQKALSTPHFAVIKGPPGSGKTTVISTIIRQSLARGERVLVVSPTHVAVDNVVEKLAPAQGATKDDLELRTLPVRFAARPKKLLSVASTYWIGPKSQKRAGTLAKRVEGCLSRTLPLARSLYAKVDDQAPGQAPLSKALATTFGAICGTPIGILSFDAVKAAEPGAFDLLIVDEVSKMTLPEFLAVAIKARRWVLVGDPEQLPPYNNIEENGTALDELFPPALELVCSIGAHLERTKPGMRHGARMVVVSRTPDAVIEAARAHLAAVGIDEHPGVGGLDGPFGILVCRPEELDTAVARLSPVRNRDRSHTPEQPGSVAILVERGLELVRPEFASGSRFVEERARAQATLFDNTFAVYHAQPWSKRARQKLTVVRFRNGIDKFLPSEAALEALGAGGREPLIAAIAMRYALNAVSVYDWLTGLPTQAFDVAPLVELADVTAPLGPLQDAVTPFVGILRRQYRMHPSLSSVPRALFYFEEALEDGVTGSGGCRVRLVQVPNGGPSETNEAEAQRIVAVLATLAEGQKKSPVQATILVITPYRAQERRLGEVIDAAASRLNGLNIEVCTLDRCQGREADYVFVSLVRGRATPFMDAPKRWNVALTRAKEGLFLVGDVEAYLREAHKARRDVVERPGFGQPLMSLLARIIESYDAQINQTQQNNERSVYV
jgi:hypothetical protein